MESDFDVIVIGLGAMGSAAAYHLAKRGVRVLGLEAYAEAHDKGSSHGETRMIRQAYFEDPAYVPLVQRAYELWNQLENECTRTLLNMTGGIAIGPRQSELIAGCLKSAKAHGLQHDLFDASETKRRFPQFQLKQNEVAFYEDRAGYLNPEECITAYLHCAGKRGADLRFNTPIIAWAAAKSGSGVRVTTEKQTFNARCLVVALGPWTGDFVEHKLVSLKVSRRVMFWMKPTTQDSSFDNGGTRCRARYSTVSPGLMRVATQRSPFTTLVRIALRSRSIEGLTKMILQRSNSQSHPEFPL